MNAINIKAVVIVLAGLLLGAVSAEAQDKTQQPAPQNLRIAILDLDAIRREAEVVKDIRTQIAGYRDGFKESIQKEEAALKTANQDLAKKRTLLSPEVFAEERRKFEEKVVAVQRLVQKSKQALGGVRANAMLGVEKTLNNIITGLAEKHNLTLILRRDVTILSSRSMDITVDVLKALNEQLPKMKVEKPVIK